MAASPHRYRFQWCDAAIATGQTLDVPQREAVTRQAQALRVNPFFWMSRLTYRGEDPDGHKLWYNPGATAQLYFSVEQGTVYVYRIGTEDIPPLEERD